MTDEKSKLKKRITRDLVFLILGLIFLGISVFNTIRKNENKVENKKTTTIRK